MYSMNTSQIIKICQEEAKLENLEWEMKHFPTKEASRAFENQVTILASYKKEFGN